MSPNRIHSHPADHGTGGRREGDNGEKGRCVAYDGCSAKRWSVNQRGGSNAKRRKWWKKKRTNKTEGDLRRKTTFVPKSNQTLTIVLSMIVP